MDADPPAQGSNLHAETHKRMGLPSGVVSTEATIGVLPGAPRPRLPPESKAICRGPVCFGVQI